LDCGPGKKAPSKVVSLKLDYNSTIGCDGVEALCLGLRSNTVLKVRVRLRVDPCVRCAT
jgi:hypothetical protein